MCCHSTKTAVERTLTTKPKYSIKERLNHPFGTILKLTVEIIDGEELNDKYHESDFLFKVKSIDSVAVTKKIIMEFWDETGKFPTGQFELYKYLHGKEVGSLDSNQSDEIKKKYVGREFNILAYEAGGFKGIPDESYSYGYVRQDIAFNFYNYLVVIADLTKSK